MLRRALLCGAAALLFPSLAQAQINLGNLPAASNAFGRMVVCPIQNTSGSTELCTPSQVAAAAGAALQSTTVSAGTGLTGGGSLASNLTISLQPSLSGLSALTWAAGLEVPTLTALNTWGLTTLGPFATSGTIPTSALTGILSASQSPAYVGDVTTSAGSLTTTLATVNSSPGPCGSATQSSALTVNGKGLTTTCTSTTITPAIGSITGLGSGVAAAAAVATNSTGGFALSGGAFNIGSATGLTLVAGSTITSGFTAGQLLYSNGSLLEPINPSSVTTTASGGNTALTFASRFGQVSNIRDFGAVCNGSTDDSAAVTAWAASLTSGVTGYVPAGNCIYKMPITFPVVNYITIKGDGLQSKLTYAGSTTTSTPITIGTPNDSGASYCSVEGWTIRDITFATSTVMTSGVGIKIGDMCQSYISNWSVGGGLGGNANFYNAVQFSGGNTIHMNGYAFQASNYAEIINGDPSASFIDMYQTHGVISHSGLGLNIAGNVGGFNIDSTDILDNGTNVLIDQSQVAVTNGQVFFGALLDIDVTSGGAGVGINLNDPGNGLLFLSGTWLASASAQCLLIQSGVQWHVTLAGGTVFNCGSDGIKNNSTAAIVSVSAVAIRGNVGYGINGTVANSNFQVHGVSFGANIGGNFSSNILPESYSIDGSTYAGILYSNQVSVQQSGTTSGTIARLGVATGSAGAYATYINVDGSTPKSEWTIGSGDTGGIEIDSTGAPGSPITLNLGTGVFNIFGNTQATGSISSTGSITSSTTVNGDVGNFSDNTNPLNFSGLTAGNSIYLHGSGGSGDNIAVISKAATGSYSFNLSGSVSSNSVPIPTNTFGTAAPSSTSIEGYQYFNTSTSPYTMYVYHSGAWHQVQ